MLRPPATAWRTSSARRRIVSTPLSWITRRASLGELLEKRAVLVEVAVAEEQLARPRPRPFSQLPGSLGVAQQGADRVGEGAKVLGVTKEDTVDAVVDLVTDAADGARNNRTPLPHRLRDGESEPFGQALLDDDGCVTLDGVDDRGRLVWVGHGRASEVNARACLVWKRPPERHALVEDLGRLRVVRDTRDG